MLIFPSLPIHYTTTAPNTTASTATATTTTATAVVVPAINFTRTEPISLPRTSLWLIPLQFT